MKSCFTETCSLCKHLIKMRKKLFSPHMAYKCKFLTFYHESEDYCGKFECSSKQGNYSCRNCEYKGDKL